MSSGWNVDKAKKIANERGLDYNPEHPKPGVLFHCPSCGDSSWLRVMSKERDHGIYWHDVDLYDFCEWRENMRLIKGTRLFLDKQGRYPQ